MNKNRGHMKLSEPYEQVINVKHIRKERSLKHDLDDLSTAFSNMGNHILDPIVKPTIKALTKLALFIDKIKKEL